MRLILENLTHTQLRFLQTWAPFWLELEAPNLVLVPRPALRRVSARRPKTLRTEPPELAAQEQRRRRGRKRHMALQGKPRGHKISLRPNKSEANKPDVC